jgi:hypothetical protein
MEIKSGYSLNMGRVSHLTSTKKEMCVIICTQFNHFGVNKLLIIVTSGNSYIPKVPTYFQSTNYYTFITFTIIFSILIVYFMKPSDYRYVTK